MLALLLCIGLGGVLTLVLRLGRVHCALAAVIAGVLVGGGVSLVVEQPAEQKTFDDLQRAHTREMQRLTETGVSEAALLEHERLGEMGSTNYLSRHNIIECCVDIRIV